MKKKNIRKNKTLWGAALGAAAAVFVSCSPLTGNNMTVNTATNDISTIKMTNSGAYLSGRVAHIRKDFDKAADYYKLIMDNNVDNPSILNQLYLLLSSQGRIDEAAEYAQQAIDKGTENVFAYMVIATKKMHDGEYEQAIKSMEKIKDPLYKSFVTPMFNAWSYAGANDKKKALDELAKLKKEDGLNSIYIQQNAMLLDYLGENREAQQAYEIVLNSPNIELSLRMLEIITNFYIRSGQKAKAMAMMDATVNSQALDSLLFVLREKIANSDEKNTLPILSSAKIGAAEALFSVVASFRYAETIDIAHMYTALTIYLNPQYSTAKILMADIFESRDMYDNANKMYDSIDEKDVGYYPAQVKKARNLIKKGDLEAAEILLKSLSDEYKDVQIYIELGDLLRSHDRYAEAVEYYDKAIALTKNKTSLWVLYYAKGIALERAGKWKKAEEVLMKAYKLKPHYLVLNYLGYTWLLHKQNVEQALEFIVEAYNQAPNDPSVNDSLGFALYNLGYYDKALPYLEKAVELYPSSAVITSHLGDAYWFAKRKNEARFQWRHVLTLKDESGEINIKQTKEKIKEGIIEDPKLDFDQEKVEAILKKIQTGEAENKK